MKARLTHCSFLMLLMLLVGAQPLLAQGVDAGRVSRVTHEVSMEVYSPFCPGKTLAMCPSPNAAEVRRDIQDMASKGMEKEAIKDAVVEKYGEEFRLQEPPASDNVMLLVAILITLFLVVLLVRFFARKGPATPDSAATDAENEGEDDYLDELRDEYKS